MTAQIGDTIRYAGEFHNLVGVSPDNPHDELFDPSRFGITTFSSCTACWRGYIATFGLRDNRLVLEELAINVRDPAWEDELKRLTELKEIRRHLPPHLRGPKPQPRVMKSGPCGPAIHGVFPVPPDHPGRPLAFSDNYHDIGMPLRFTGGLLLSKGFIRSLYEHMGFHPAWKFEKVIELTFSEGVLTAAYDRSAEMAEVRDAKSGASGYDSKRFDSPAQMVGWIAKCFDRRY